MHIKKRSHFIDRLIEARCKNGSRSKSRALHNKQDSKTRVPWCTDFGNSKEERKENFPDAKFCSNKYEDWENEGLNTRSKQTSCCFACQSEG
eukprot:scaffold24735_cov54-Attheya_sp.AAC.4